MKADVAAVQSERIFTVCTMYMNRTVERFAEIGAYKVFVTELSTEGGAPQSPIEVTVKVYSENIGAMIIERHIVFRSSYKFKTVDIAVPID